MPMINKYATKKAARWTSLDGRVKTTIEWATELGIKPDSLRARLRRGWTIGQAVDGERYSQIKGKFRGYHKYRNGVRVIDRSMTDNNSACLPSGASPLERHR